MDPCINTDSLLEKWNRPVGREAFISIYMPVHSQETTMSGSLKICNVGPELKEKMKKFRFKKSTETSAIIFKIVKESQELAIDEELEDCGIEEIVGELPETQPRFVLISYKLSHKDGRISYPLCLVFFSPQGCSPEIKMLYAGSKNSIVKETGAGKDFEIRELEELTSEFLEAKLIN